MGLGEPGFLRRIYMYLTGVIIGTVFVYFTMYKNRDLPSFWPAGKVKESIINSTVSWEESTLCPKTFVGINDEVFESLIKNGKVRFNQSEPRRKPHPIYHIESVDKYAGKLIFKIELADSTSSVRSIEYADENKTFDCQ
jgi:hypothetical protein